MNNWFRVIFYAYLLLHFICQLLSITASEWVCVCDAWKLVSGTQFSNNHFSLWNFYFILFNAIRFMISKTYISLNIIISTKKKTFSPISSSLTSNEKENIKYAFRCGEWVTLPNRLLDEICFEFCFYLKMEWKIVCISAIFRYIVFSRVWMLAFRDQNLIHIDIQQTKCIWL